MKSLRARLVFFWLILMTVCLALASVMLLLYRDGTCAQIGAVQTQADQACTAIASRYAKSLAAPAQQAPQLDLLQVLLQLVLLDAQGVEGGVAGLARLAARTQWLQTDDGRCTAPPAGPASRNAGCQRAALTATHTPRATAPGRHCLPPFERQP